MRGAARSPFATGWRAVRRIAIAVAGLVVLAAGVLMLLLPGPAFVVIPAGLALLAVEFEWARRWLHGAERAAARAMRVWRRRGS